MDKELASQVGYHDVTSAQARELLQPYLHTDGFYLFRPSRDRQAGVLCTICVTNKSRLMNYRLIGNQQTSKVHIHTHTTFAKISDLVQYYKSTPINAEANTRLLFPIGAPTNEQDGGEQDTYVIMEKNEQQQPNHSNAITTDSQPNNSIDIPGLHLYLPKSELQSVMRPHLSRNGSYLLRPSSTSQGQLTLAVSHSGKVMNFKINYEKGQYYIAPRRRYNTIQELLVCYRTNPIKSKRGGDSGIYLLHPIPVNQAMELKYQQKLEQKANANKPPSKPPLPEPWQEHYNEQYKRLYYFNPKTNESVWERPKPPPSPKTTPTHKSPPSPKPPPSPRPNMRHRPLPVPPGTDSAGTQPSSTPLSRTATMGSSSPAASRRRFSEQPLPAVPNKNDTPSSPGRPHRAMTEKRPGRTGSFNRPPLPPKEEHGIQNRDLPPLPPKSHEGSASPSHTRMRKRPPMPLPEEPQETKPVATLPPKVPVQTNRGQHPLPPLPPKEEKQAPPPLPEKSDNDRVMPLQPPPPARDHFTNKTQGERQPPPLPEKAEENETTVPPQRAGPLKSISNKNKPRKRVVEYEDHVLSHQAQKKKEELVVEPPPCPPLPEKESSPPPTVAVNGLSSVSPPPPTVDTTFLAPPAAGGSVPAPPPPPAIGVPPPPPLPPAGPPPPSPMMPRSPKIESNSKSFEAPGSPSSGRPFTATDLSQAKTLLKKREAPDPGQKKNPAASGIAGVFANAIDERMNSIRKAVVDSDSDESEFEEVDDEDWD